MDDFASDIAERCLLTREHFDGEINTAWSTGEQLAVALVLEDWEHLEWMQYTRRQAVDRVLDGMERKNRPGDFEAWLRAIQDTINPA